MRNYIFIILLLTSCSPTKSSQAQNYNTSEDQIFISSQTDGLPGKCYQKMMTSNSQTKFTEVLCASEVTKDVIELIQINLNRLGYTLEVKEIEKKEFGQSTKEAIKQFQQKNNFAFGGLDWATINKLKNQ